MNPDVLMQQGENGECSAYSYSDIIHPNRSVVKCFSPFISINFAPPVPRSSVCSDESGENRAESGISFLLFPECCATLFLHPIQGDFTDHMKQHRIRDYLMMTAGTVLMTVGVYFFKIPNGFSTGGVSGIGTLLGKITPYSPATWISVLNVALLILGFAVLGRSTGVRTVYCSLLFSGLTQALEWLVPLDSPLTDQPFLELAYAMILTAFGSALIFHSQASSGGTDIVALILKKYTSLNVGTALLCVDFLIAVCAFFVFDVKTGLFSLAGLFAKAFLVDSVIENLNVCKYFVVVTTRTYADEISSFILTSLGHGATVEYGQGAFTHEDKVILHTVCRRSEAPSLQRRIKELDPSAFIIITTSSEIIGRGFRGSL